MSDDLNQTQSEINRLKQELEAKEAKVRQIQQQKAMEVQKKKELAKEKRQRRIEKYREMFEYLDSLKDDQIKLQAVCGSYTPMDERGGRSPDREPHLHRIPSLLSGAHEGGREDQQLLIIIGSLHEQYMEKFEELEQMIRGR